MIMAKTKKQADSKEKAPPMQKADKAAPGTPDKAERPSPTTRQMDRMMAPKPEGEKADQARTASALQRSVGNTRVNQMAAESEQAETDTDKPDAATMRLSADLLPEPPFTTEKLRSLSQSQLHKLYKRYQNTNPKEAHKVKMEQEKRTASKKTPQQPGSRNEQNQNPEQNG